MKQDSRELPDNLIMALITHIYIGWGLLYLAKLATLHLTYNAYWGILVALLIVIPFLWLVSVLTRTYPGLSISQVFGKIFGTTLGITLAIIFFLHIAYFQLIFLRDSQLMVYTYFFKKTPLILMTGLLMAGVLYTAWHGAWSIARLAAFMLFPPFLIILGLQFIGLANINVLNLQPVFGGSVRDWFLAGTDLVTILLPGLGISICISFLKRPGSLKKITIYSLGMVLPLFLLNILGIVGTFGPMVMKKLSWPAVEYFHQIDFPFLLLEQAGLFFLIAWYASIFVTMGVGAFFIGNEFHIIFPRIKREWITVAYCVVLLIIVNLPISMIASEKFFKSTHKWIALSFLSFFVIAWLVDRLRSKK